MMTEEHDDKPFNLALRASGDVGDHYSDSDGPFLLFSSRGAAVVACGFIRANPDAPPEAIFIATGGGPAWSAQPFAWRAALTVFRDVLLLLDRLLAEEEARQSQPPAARRAIPPDERTLQSGYALADRVHLGRLGKITPAIAPPGEAASPLRDASRADKFPRPYADPRLARPGYKLPSAKSQPPGKGGKK